MQLEQLESGLMARLPENAATGQQVSAAMSVPELGDLDVRLAVARNGDRRWAYTLAGRRVQRDALLHLLCKEHHCPRSQAVHRRWLQGDDAAAPASGRGKAPKPAPARGFMHRALRIQPLMEESPIAVGGRQFVARPAVWQCQRPCPTQAHAPQTLSLPGWDLFEGTRWIAGGIERQPGGGQRPCFQHFSDVEKWLHAKHLNAPGLHGQTV